MIEGDAIFVKRMHSKTSTVLSDTATASSSDCSNRIYHGEGSGQPAALSDHRYLWCFPACFIYFYPLFHFWRRYQNVQGGLPPSDYAARYFWRHLDIKHFSRR